MPRVFLTLLLFVVAAGRLASAASPYFVIVVVDYETGRGIPMVQARTNAYVTHMLPLRHPG